MKLWPFFCYLTAPDVTATWFIDPPYKGEAGRLYRHHSIDYAALAGWCRSRRGQVIVCERQGASWLPFLPLTTVKATPGSRGKGTSAEVVWQHGPAQRALFTLTCDILAPPP